MFVTLSHCMSIVCRSECSAIHDPVLRSIPFCNCKPVLEDHVAMWMKSWHFCPGFHGEQGGEAIHAIINEPPPTTPVAQWQSTGGLSQRPWVQTPVAPPFFLSLCRFKGLRTVTAPIVFH